MQSFQAIKDYKTEICKIKSETDGEKDIKIVLVGNKCDLETERVVPQELGKQMAKEWGCPFYEISVKNKVNVMECVDSVLFQIVKELNDKEKETVVIVGMKSKKGTVYEGFGKKLDNGVWVPHGFGSVRYVKDDHPVIKKYKGWWHDGMKYGPGVCKLRTSGNVHKGIWKDGACLAKVQPK
eukprot:TRINITY_DN2570_c0_g1_i2.p1 TRINITY_DN2570_c0_g1~~TRINITY_DN2570_c0_g1_i2.p1  ORF type:complete len:181 (-),score=36.51 TRINITY_DN2570_c0_g1_i2:21-563(-)